jgi:hypothetical protein
MEIECPKCREWLDINDSYQTQADCPTCESRWTVDYDAEFVDGSWRDLTRLIERTSKPMYYDDAYNEAWIHKDGSARRRQ